MATLRFRPLASNDCKGLRVFLQAFYLRQHGQSRGGYFSGHAGAVNKTGQDSLDAGLFLLFANGYSCDYDTCHLFWIVKRVEWGKSCSMQVDMR